MKNEEWEKEKTWGSLAIASAVIVLVLAFICGLWVFRASGQEMVYRSQALAPFGLLGLATVTFCTIVWRGFISGRQADTSLAQLDGLKRQIAVAEEANLATQLQKGAELISDDKQSRVAAGIATLGSVAKAGPQSFGDEARLLLLDYVREFGKITHNEENLRRAASALSKAFETRPALLVEELNFDEAYGADLAEGLAADWAIIQGAEEVSYKGGSFFEKTFDARPTTSFRFYEVAFNRCTFPDLRMLWFKDCQFDGCEIRKTNSDILSENKFQACDFSGAVIVINSAMPDLREGSNGYYEEHPPTIDGNPGPPFQIEEKLVGWGGPPDDDDWHPAGPHRRSTRNV